MNHKKSCAALVLCLCLLLSGGCGKTEEEEKLAENQAYVYAMVTSIQGNEITYTEIEESLITSILGAETDTEIGPESGDETTGGLKDEANDRPGDETTGDLKDETTGGPKDEANDRPRDETDSVTGNGPEGEMKNDINSKSGEESRNESGRTKDAPMTGDFYQENSSSAQQMRGGLNLMSGGETVTTYIPVGTPVHTTADAVTTFSRLAAGDVLKMLVETREDGTETIVEIWMQM